MDGSMYDSRPCAMCGTAIRSAYLLRDHEIRHMLYGQCHQLPHGLNKAQSQILETAMKFEEFTVFIDEAGNRPFEDLDEFLSKAGKTFDKSLLSPLGIKLAPPAAPRLLRSTHDYYV